MVYNHKTKSGKMIHFRNKGSYENWRKGMFANQGNTQTKTKTSKLKHKKTFNKSARLKKSLISRKLTRDQKMDLGDWIHESRNIKTKQDYLGFQERLDMIRDRPNALKYKQANVLDSYIDLSIEKIDNPRMAHAAISELEAIKRHLMQSQEAQEKDLMEQAGTVYGQPTEQWMINPKQSDVKGIDTKTGSVFGKTEHLKAKLGHLERTEKEEKLKKASDLLGFVDSTSSEKGRKIDKALKGKVHKKFIQTNYMVHGSNLNPFGKLLVEEKETHKRIDEIDIKLKHKFHKGSSFGALGGLSGWEARKKIFMSNRKDLRKEKKKLTKRMAQIQIDKEIEIEKL